MSDETELTEWLSRGFHEDSGPDLVNRFGGVLRCETCLRTEPLSGSDAGRFLAAGWPKCHEQTMRWWTQRQIDVGEMETCRG